MIQYYLLYAVQSWQELYHGSGSINIEPEFSVIELLELPGQGSQRRGRAET